MTAVGLALLVVAGTLWLVVAVRAFRTGVGQGLACLCVPFYALYYGFAKLQHRRRGLILATWLIAAALGTALVQCGTAVRITEEIRGAGAPAGGR